MTILLHICCAPCSIVPIDRFRAEGVDLLGWWFNPNIHPYTENETRRTTLEKYAEKIALPIRWRNEYRLEDFLRAVAFNEMNRCRTCLRWRLETAAVEAKSAGCEAFSTTLLYSKYQPHELIAEIGAQVSEAKSIPFHYRDFRPFWREGVDRSRAEGMYRQKYCGCIYSEKERYLGKKDSPAASSSVANPQHT
ncbi:MAG: epoxyqueuosine reductase QueH [Myxococcales bacterium]|nr:epoxyqueuosine reductase QueH [Myxococcales bacterium]